MSEAAHSLQRTVDEITGYGRRTRKLVIRAAAVAVVLFILFGFLYFRLHQSQLDNCAAGNQTRMKQEQLWNTVFTLSAQSSSTPQTAQTRKLTAVFLHAVQVTYAPVNCAARYPLW